MTNLPIPVILLVFVLGAVIGSFLNVIIFRVPRKLPFARGRSSCPHCGHLIRWHQNIPLVSYVALGGKCAHCKGRISLRYPVVELLTALAFVGWVWRLGLTLEAAGFMYLSAVLICVFFIDWEFQIIPDLLTYPSLAVGLIWALFSPLGIVDSLFGAVVGGGGLLLVALAGDWLFKKESMGGGDIKLAAVLGAFLGWRLVVLVFFLSAFLGAVISALWGPELILWYWRNFWMA